MADSLLEYFSAEENIDLIDSLKTHGLQMEMEEVEGATEKLAGLSIVVSGVFEIHDRKGIKALIELNGAKSALQFLKKLRLS